MIVATAAAAAAAEFQPATSYSAPVCLVSHAWTALALLSNKHLIRAVNLLSIQLFSFENTGCCLWTLYGAIHKRKGD